MGARWPWHAKCKEGHRFIGFSGGSDGTCDECGAPILEEYPCYRGMWGDNTGCPLDDDYVPAEYSVHTCTDCGRPHETLVTAAHWSNIDV